MLFLINVIYVSEGSNLINLGGWKALKSTGPSGILNLIIVYTQNILHI